MASKRFRDTNGKMKGTTIHLHRYVMGMENEGEEFVVDHIHPNETLDNRKRNLRVTTWAKNDSNRKGANKNSKTGVRNVTYIKAANQYWVQIMKDYKRHIWKFQIDQFEQACEFAEIKRKELFQDHCGNG